jgi:hypothetical protein
MGNTAPYVLYFYLSIPSHPCFVRIHNEICQYILLLEKLIVAQSNSSPHMKPKDLQEPTTGPVPAESCPYLSLFILALHVVIIVPSIPVSPK